MTNTQEESSQHMEQAGGMIVGDNGSPTGVDAMTTENSGGKSALQVPLAAPAAVSPMAVRPKAVRPMAVRPAPVAAAPAAGGGPQAVAQPQLIRPKAVRPDAHAAMLERLAQDFQNHPPPVAPMEEMEEEDEDEELEPPFLAALPQPLQQPPIEIINVPPRSVVKQSEDDGSVSTTTASTRTGSVSVLQSPKMTPTGGAIQRPPLHWGSSQLQINPTVTDAKRRLRARRTLSESNLGAGLLFSEDMQQEEGQGDEQRAEQQPQLPKLSAPVPAPAPAQAPAPLQQPKPLRPVPLKASQSQSMMNQIAHDFQNLPTQQIRLSRAPSAPPPQDHSSSSLSYSLPQRSPSVAPQQPHMMMQPTPMMMNQSRPRHSRRSSGRHQKASWYHRVAAQNKLGSIQEDPFLNTMQEDDEENSEKETGTVGTGTVTGGRLSPLTMSYYTHAPWDRIQAAKKELLQELNQAALAVDGDNNTPAFQAALQTLIQNYDPSLFDPRAPVLAYHPYQMQLEGIGISAGKPTFPGCIGRNPQGDPMYKLGTMSFDMFRPTELVVSVQGTFVLIDSVDRNNLQEVKNVPKNLQNDVRHGINPVRTYNIVTPFTIEAWRPEFGEKSPNKGVSEPIHGVMTTYGFLLPYPTQNRFSVWFTGGSLEVDGNKNEKWFQIFDKKAAPKRTAFESSKVLAAKLLMGACVNDEMDIEGTLKYTLTRPVASYIDLIYLDNSLQVLRGSSGTVYVHVRLPGGSGAVHQSTHSDQMLPTPVDPMATAPACSSNNHHLPRMPCSPDNRFLL